MIIDVFCTCIYVTARYVSKQTDDDCFAFLELKLENWNISLILINTTDIVRLYCISIHEHHVIATNIKSITFVNRNMIFLLKSAKVKT